jgi:arylsulfatase A-like enzyme
MAPGSDRPPAGVRPRSREGPAIAERKLRPGGAVAGFREQSWTPDRYREVLAAYYGQVSMIDRGMSRILDALETADLAGGTVVVFTADHGDHAGRFGWFSRARCTRGPPGCR